LGKAYADLGKDGLAKKNYLKSIFLNPERPEAYLNIGDIYRREQKWDSASYYLRQGIGLQKENVNLITNLGNVFFDQSNIEKDKKESLLIKARHQFINALQIDSLCLEANFGLGNCYWESSKYDSAATFYSICVMLDSNDVINSNYYIEALTRSGKEKLAEKLAMKLSLKYPDNATNWFDLTVLAAMKKDYKQAEIYMTKSIKSGNKDRSWFEEDVYLGDFKKQPGFKKLLNSLK
jgi:tetratricopeptide (TPR) repeat protein